ncbi:MAG TPA: hypothetical protein VK489_00620 [Ferruginibacter sp.]|nr:hypothetical protein [Ferruginibacter sp.]
MKKAFLLHVLLFVSVFSFAQVNLQSLVKPGTKLIYAVEANEEKYDFIVTVKALLPALVFDWEMTNGSKGSITHTQQAMISANTMYNYFKPGEKTLDDNSISVWLSKNTFRALGKEGAMIKMNTGEAERKMGTNAGTNEFSILVNGEKERIEEEVAKELNKEGNQTGSEDFFSFYNSFKLPIILRMRNGFYIALKEIRTN